MPNYTVTWEGKASLHRKMRDKEQVEAGSVTEALDKLVPVISEKLMKGGKPYSITKITVNEKGRDCTGSFTAIPSFMKSINDGGQLGEPNAEW